MKFLLFLLNLIFIFSLKIDLNSLSSSILSEIEFRTTSRPLIYLFSPDILEIIINKLKYTLNINNKHIKCYNLNNNYPENDLDNYYNKEIISLSSSLSYNHNNNHNNNEEEYSIIVFYNMESLKEDNITKLNFLHSVSDSLSKYSNLLVILVWNTSIKNINEKNIQQELLNYFQSGGPTINPHALLGRISRKVLTSSLPSSSYQYWIPSSNLCNTDSSSSDNNNTNDSSQLLIVITILIGLPILFYFRFGKNQQQLNQKKTSNLSTQNNNQVKQVEKISKVTIIQENITYSKTTIIKESNSNIINNNNNQVSDELYLPTSTFKQKLENNNSTDNYKDYKDNQEEEKEKEEEENKNDDKREGKEEEVNNDNDNNNNKSEDNEYWSQPSQQ